jgi:histidyl-tRNA synthetase
MQSIRGMRDVLPAEARRWQRVEAETIRTLESFGYEEIRLPLLESTELFSRGLGEATDAVEKEMYNLLDRDGEKLSLRPEGTASCVRAGLQHGLIFNQTPRLWYRGPMFRYERPQKGRYRQFDQIGAEVFGVAGADVDAELIQMSAVLFRSLGLSRELRLELNTLGSAESRRAYRDALVAYLTPRRDALDVDSQRRLERNPLRILDSKDVATRAVLEGAPTLTDYLDDESRAHFDGVRRLLDALQIGYVVNTRLVRGLDYYTHTVFEWMTDALGSQGTVCAGGRYDGLVEQLGGRPTPGAGFAVGVDRLVLLHEALGQGVRAEPVDGYCVVQGDAHQAWAMATCQRVRDALPQLRLRRNAGGGKLKNQMKRADASGADWALIVGEDEVANDEVTLKWLRADLPQERLSPAALIRRLAGWLDARDGLRE